MKENIHNFFTFPELINEIDIVTDTGVKFTISEFMDKLETLRVLFN